MNIVIRPQSYQSASGHWIPSVSVLKDLGEESIEQALTLRDHRQTSREAADSFALSVARAQGLVS
jgi:hypothetical protein